MNKQIRYINHLSNPPYCERMCAQFVVQQSISWMNWSYDCLNHPVNSKRSRQVNIRSTTSHGLILSDILNEYRCDQPINTEESPALKLKSGDPIKHKPLNPFIDLNGHNPPRYVYWRKKSISSCDFLRKHTHVEWGPSESRQCSYNHQYHYDAVHYVEYSDRSTCPSCQNERICLSPCEMTSWCWSNDWNILVLAVENNYIDWATSCRDPNHRMWQR